MDGDDLAGPASDIGTSLTRMTRRPLSEPVAPCADPGLALSFGWPSLRRWSSRGLWAVVDQALFAGSNLLVNVLLARWLPQADYGAFVAAYTVLLLVQIAHSALLIEPMLIFGADRHQASFSHYLRILQRYHWRLMVGVSAVLAVAAVVIAVTTDTRLGKAVAGLAVTAPFILLSWLARRACYGASRPRLAAVGGAINLIVVGAGIVMLTNLGMLSVLSGQLLLGVAALATTVCLLPPLGRVTAVPLTAAARSTVWSDHWRYARWSSASGALAWFHTFMYYLALPMWSGLAAAGSLRALLNLITPILHSDGALVTLLLPQFVRSRRVTGQLSRVVAWTAAGFSMEAALYWLMLVVFGQRLVTWLYGDVYQYDTAAIAMIGAIPLLTSLVNIFGNALRAREEPDGVFWATVAAVAVAGTVGLGAVALLGLGGAVLGMVGSSVVQAGVMLWLLSRRPSTERAHRPAAVGAVLTSR
jgi:O-antigen/teichoic acid export membrane protein